jgi:hypothetical protein
MKPYDIEHITLHQEGGIMELVTAYEVKWCVAYVLQISENEVPGTYLHPSATEKLETSLHRL